MAEAYSSDPSQLSSQQAALLAELKSMGIQDQAVLDAMAAVPRERFVEDAFQGQAYGNRALPIACGQTISQPYVVALMTQALRVGAEDKVLEVGTGSGYQAAVLGHLAKRVFTIERHRSLSRVAEARLRELDLTNVVVIEGDGTKGWSPQAPFDRILVTAAAARVPQPLKDQVRVGGHIVAPVGPEFGQELVRLTKTDSGFTRDTLTAVRFVPLVGESG